MNTQHQAYIDGFVKRAAEYGLNENEALDILKQATAADAPAMQQEPSFAQGAKNFGKNLISYPKALYQGLMGHPSAADHPGAVPFVTGGPAGPRGFSGIRQRLKNYGQHVDRTSEASPGLTGLGAVLGAETGRRYADSLMDNKGVADQTLGRFAGDYLGARTGAGLGAAALPLAGQQLGSMWDTQRK